MSARILVALVALALAGCAAAPENPESVELAVSDRIAVETIGHGHWSEFGGCSAWCFYTNWFWVDIDVRNDAYDKEVGILWTSDGWATVHTALATFEYTLNTSHERWGVDVQLPSSAHAPSIPTVEFAVFATMNDTTYWDPGNNHTVQNLEHWIGATYSTPTINHDQDLELHTETWPPGDFATVDVHYTTDGGASWNTAPLSMLTSSQNDWWYANLGSFAPGTTVEYYLESYTVDGDRLYEDNVGANHFVDVRPGGPVWWAGNTLQWPANGALDAGEDLYIDIESWPAGNALYANVHFYAGSIWLTEPMTRDDALWGNNDHWWANLGPFATGMTVQYAVEVIDGDGRSYWDNNGGGDFYAWVQ